MLCSHHCRPPLPHRLPRGMRHPGATLSPRHLCSQLHCRCCWLASGGVVVEISQHPSMRGGAGKKRGVAGHEQGQQWWWKESIDGAVTLVTPFGVLNSLATPCDTQKVQNNEAQHSIPWCVAAQPMCHDPRLWVGVYSCISPKGGLQR